MCATLHSIAWLGVCHEERDTDAFGGGFRVDGTRIWVMLEVGL